MSGLGQVGTRPYAGCVPTVELVFVRSSALDAVGFDRERSELHVRFPDGGTYVYSDVPEQVHRELLEAESKGGFFVNVIQPGYAAREL